ncbi:MAG: ribonuclease HII [Candidatus Gastranaerophilaceae bacterium]|nr:ribonuclease HII [Christensenellales bacterium]
MKKPDERQRLSKLTIYEKTFWDKGQQVAGMDEVGRGPLAGPVMAACVVMPCADLIEGVDDSKKLTVFKREALNTLIRKNAIAYGIGKSNEQEIDELNILNATKLAFSRAYNNMTPGFIPDAVLIDAVKGIDVPVEQIAIIHGDTVSYLIAAASIVAKVERDSFMIKMDELYPQYGFSRNKGYGTKEHMDALIKYGPCPIHRKSFIKKIIGDV